MRSLGEMAEPVEGAPLLREYGVKNSIEGSNPSLSAIIKSHNLYRCPVQASGTCRFASCAAARHDAALPDLRLTVKKGVA